MKHEKTFEAIDKLKDIEMELHRLKNALEMANKALDAQRQWVRLTKTVVGNHLRRHALGDQSTFRQGFKEGVAFAELKLKEKNI